MDVSVVKNQKRGQSFFSDCQQSLELAVQKIALELLLCDPFFLCTWLFVSLLESKFVDQNHSDVSELELTQLKKRMTGFWGHNPSGVMEEKSWCVLTCLTPVSLIKT